MSEVYKIPKEMHQAIDKFMANSGCGLHVIEDIDGNSCLSKEEVHSKEFQKFFSETVKTSVTDKLELIPYKPRPSWTLADIQAWRDAQDQKESEEIK